MTDLEKTIDDLKLLNTLCHGTVLDDAIALLKGQQHIVRCKDCKHGKINICDEFTTCYNAYSCLYGNTRKSNWWCADGVKRDA